MSRFVRRAQETGKELSWIAASEALRSAGIGLDRVDAVCLTSAPDAFDGVHMKGEYLSDGAGAFGKPMIRSYVGGGSGVFSSIQGWYTVSSGMADVRHWSIADPEGQSPQTVRLIRDVLVTHVQMLAAELSVAA